MSWLLVVMNLHRIFAQFASALQIYRELWFIQRVSLISLAEKPAKVHEKCHLTFAGKWVGAVGADNMEKSLTLFICNYPYCNDSSPLNLTIRLLSKCSFSIWGKSVWTIAVVFVHCYTAPLKELLCFRKNIFCYVKNLWCIDV